MELQNLVPRPVRTKLWLRVGLAAVATMGTSGARVHHRRVAGASR